MQSCGAGAGLFGWSRSRKITMFRLRLLVNCKAENYELKKIIFFPDTKLQNLHVRLQEQVVSTIHQEPELEPKLRNFSAPAPAKKAGSGSATLLLTVACVLDNKNPNSSQTNKCSEERSTLDS